MSGWAQRDAERREAQEDEDALDLVDYARVSERIMTECDRYGLPYGDPLQSFEGLLRHIYGNRDLTIETWKAVSARSLERLADVWQEGQEHKHNEQCGLVCNPYTKETT